MPNKDCGETRKHTKKAWGGGGGGACLTETVEIQEGTQREGHACLTAAVEIQRGIQKGDKAS